MLCCVVAVFPPGQMLQLASTVLVEALLTLGGELEDHKWENTPEFG